MTFAHEPPPSNRLPRRCSDCGAENMTVYVRTLDDVICRRCWGQTTEFVEQKNEQHAETER